MVDVGGAADRGGVGEDVGGVAQQDLFAEAGGDFVAVDRGVAGSEVDQWFHADAAVITEQEAQPM